MKLSFENTKVAFKHKSDLELKKSYSIFKALKYPLIVNYGPKLANLLLKIRFPIKGIIKKTIFKQFCGGETIQESYHFAKKLYKDGIVAILDYSVEGEGSTENFLETYNELKLVITEASNNPEYPFAVFKCSGIGPFSVLAKKASNSELTEEHEESYNQFAERFNELCQLASDHHVKLLIDAEETWIQNTIDDLVYDNSQSFNQEEIVVYNTIQMYRKGRIKEIKKQIDCAREKGYKLGFKLVRGAYMEKEIKRAVELGYSNPIQDSKEATDQDYDAALRLCFENRDIVSIMAGTHNEKSSLLFAQLIEDHQLDNADDRFWFAQLYGMSDHISYNLAYEGYNVAKYLPYGPVKEVLPYLSRRAQENSSVKGQSSRELSLIKQELKRRKTLK
ncbi:MAG: proline dehydrogenase family protein [Bacteroidota bacterium]